MKKLYLTLVTALFSIALAACGGGGDDDQADTTTPVVDNGTVDINEIAGICSNEKGYVEYSDITGTYEKFKTPIDIEMEKLQQAALDLPGTDLLDLNIKISSRLMILEEKIISSEIAVTKDASYSNKLTLCSNRQILVLANEEIKVAKIKFPQYAKLIDELIVLQDKAVSVVKRELLTQTN